MFEKELTDSRVFEKLESLDLGGLSINKNLEPLDSFLTRTPNLKNLALRVMEKQLVVGGGRVNEIRYDRLKTVKIVCWKDDRGVNALVNHAFTKHQNIIINSMDRIPGIDVSSS